MSAKGESPGQARSAKDEAWPRRYSGRIRDFHTSNRFASSDSNTRVGEDVRAQKAIENSECQGSAWCDQISPANATQISRKPTKQAAPGWLFPSPEQREKTTQPPTLAAPARTRATPRR